MFDDVIKLAKENVELENDLRLILIQLDAVKKDNINLAESLPLCFSDYGKKIQRLILELYKNT